MRVTSLAVPFLSLVICGSSNAVLAVPSASYNWTGFYVGAYGQGYNTGVIVPTGSLGYNIYASDSLLWGGELSLGYQLPAKTYEVFVNGKLGTPISDQVLGYATAGVGSIGGTGVWAVGGGIEYAMTEQLALKAELKTRGLLGSGPAEFGIATGFNYYIDKVAFADPESFALGDHGGPDFYAGVSGSFVPGVDAFIPAVEFGADCYPTDSFFLGARVRAGVQLKSSPVPEFWLGAKVGVPVTDMIDLYGAIDFGMIGSAPVNGISVGGTWHYDPRWDFGGEIFVRGLAGSLTEGGGKLGVYYRFDAPPPPPPP